MAIKTLASYLFFPFIMAGGLTSTHLLMNQGVAPGLAALVAVVLFGLLLIPLIERLLPYKEEWNRSDEDVGPDVVYLLVNALIPKLWTPIQVMLLVGVTAWGSETFAGSLWPSHWHWLPQLFLMLLIAEFGRYWIHYAAHKNAWLWRFHAIHHSPNRLYFLNAARFHPLEKLWFQIPEVAPFIVLGTPVEIIALYFTFNGLHGLMQHCNVNMKLGFLNYIFSMAELHRWHHSKNIEESDTNFGNNLIIWDMVFGTYFNPSKRKPNTIGLLNSAYPKGLWGQFKAPFDKRDLSKPVGWVGDDTSKVSQAASG